MSAEADSTQRRRGAVPLAAEGAGGDGGAPPPTWSPRGGQKQQQQRLEEILEAVRSLRDDVFRFWLAHGPDREHGGFHAVRT